MVGKNVLATVIASTVLGSVSFAQSGLSSYQKEYKRVVKKYEANLKDIADAKNAGEWDESFHKMQNFMAQPGDSKLSNTAICAHLKTISRDELEYMGSVIEAESSRESLKECRTELLSKINHSVKLRRASFDLGSEIANLPRFTTEVRVIEQDKDRFSVEGLRDHEVMLTFDDGPRASTTPMILDILKKANVQAGFFNLGGNAMANKQVVARLLREGHVLGSHTYQHTLSMAANTRCGKMSYDQFLSELITGHVGVHRAANFIDPFFRFPNGDADSDMRRNVKELGLKDFRWNADSHDWEFPAGKIPDYETRRRTILQTLAKELKGLDKKPQFRDRGILLFHDIHQQTVDTLPMVLNYLWENGYKIVLLVPPNRQLTSNQEFPLVDQAEEYLSQNHISLTSILPPTVGGVPGGTPTMVPNFRTKVDLFEMFPGVGKNGKGLTKPWLVPVPQVCQMEADARKAEREGNSSRANALRVQAKALDEKIQTAAREAREAQEAQDFRN